MLARLEFYHLNHASVLIALGYFADGVLLFTREKAWTAILLTTASHVAGTTGMLHI
jgi:hypothetical protein